MGKLSCEWTERRAWSWAGEPGPCRPLELQRSGVHCTRFVTSLPPPTSSSPDLHTTFLEPCNGMFWVGRIYTEMNADRHRFGVWCEAALEYLRHHAEKRMWG